MEETKGTDAIPLIEPRKVIDLDNPDDVDYLYKYAQVADTEVRRLTAALSDREAELAKVRGELEEAKNRNMSSMCVYCGFIQEHEDAEQRLIAMAEHMMTCDKHPFKKMYAVFEALESQLTALRAERDALRFAAETAEPIVRHHNEAVAEMLRVALKPS